MLGSNLPGAYSLPLNNLLLMGKQKQTKRDRLTMAVSGTADQDASPLHLPPAPQSLYGFYPSATKIELSLRQNIGQFIWPASIYGLKFILIFFLLYLNQLSIFEFVVRFLKGFLGCS